jgi:coproporphyrinogen III oxidase
MTHAVPAIPLPEPAELERRKLAASAWFRTLRDRICADLEALERITGQFIDDPRAFRLNAATFEA